MVNQTANFDIPFLDGTELVRDYPTFSEDLANAVDDGLVSARGLVAVKDVLKTDTFTASVSGGGNVAVTDLSITHALQNSENKLLISAYFGAAANAEGRGQVGLAVADDGTLIAVGDASGVQIRVGAGGYINATQNSLVVTMPSVQFVYEPGDTATHTYTVRALNIRSGTRTLFVNRSQLDGNVEDRARTASSLVIQEVAV